MFKEYHYDRFKEIYNKATILYPELNDVTVYYNTSNDVGCKVLEGENEDAGAYIIVCENQGENGENEHNSISSFISGLSILIAMIKYDELKNASNRVEFIASIAHSLSDKYED